MRILHTADWHLGKKLDFYSRHQEQIQVLNEISEIADQQNADIVLIAGDLYDTFNPPIESQELLYDTLYRLAKNGSRPVVAIAGNHDSAERIDSPDVLAKQCGILFMGSPDLRFQPFEMKGGPKIICGDQGFLEIQLPQYDYNFRLILTPFANEMRLKAYLGNDEQIGLNQMLAQRWQYLADTYCDNQGVNFLMTHFFFGKKGELELEEPEGERKLKVGFSDLIYTDIIPKQIQYVALGHLHRMIRLEDNMVYSGSPLAYSFGESGQQKQVLIIDATPEKPIQIYPIALQSGKALYRLRCESVEEALEWLAQHPDALVELTLCVDRSISQQERKLIEKSHQGVIHIIPVRKKNGSTTSDSSDSVMSRRSQSIDQSFIDYYKQTHQDVAPSAEIIQLFQEIVSKNQK